MTEEELNEGKKLLFENDNYEFFEVLTYSVAIYYGGEKTFSRYSWSQLRGGHLFFLINKADHDSSFYIHINESGNVSSENFDDEVLSFSDISQNYPFIIKYIGDYVDWFSTTTYLGLKKLAEGTIPKSSWTLGRMDSLIDDVKFAKKNPKNSVLFLKFDDDEQFFKTFDISEDTIWILNRVFSSYGGGYEFIDYGDDYDWREGRVFYSFNNENLAKLDEILKLFAPTLSMLNGDGDWESAVEIFDNIYPRFGEDVWSDYVNMENEGRNEQFKKEVREETCDVYEKFGIYSKTGCFYKYITTVGNALRLYEKSGLYDKDLYYLISHFGHKLDVTDYGEYMYEIYGEFDTESFNRSVTHYVDKFYDVVMEGDLIKDINEYRKVLTDLQKKYKINKWYDFPANKKHSFNLVGVDPKTNKIIVDLRRGGFDKGSGRTQMTYDDFMKTINNLSLF